MSETNKSNSKGNKPKKKYKRKYNRLSGMPIGTGAAPEGIVHWITGLTDKLRGISVEERDKIGPILPKGLMKSNYRISSGDTLKGWTGVRKKPKKKKITPAKQVVKRAGGGKVGRPRGVGVALRGYGKAMKRGK